MESGIFLEEQVQQFCSKYNKEEGYIWQAINSIHTKTYNRNIMWEKQKEEQENNTGDIPMAQAFAKAQLVHNVISILRGLTNCCEHGWSLED